MSNWVDEELCTLDLGDKRRQTRTAQMLETMAKHPSGSIPETFQTPPEIKAAYRLLSSDAVEPQMLHSAVHQAAWERAQ